MTSESLEPPKPPDGLGVSGRSLWVSVTLAFDLEEHELALLVEACRTRDVLDRLASSMDRGDLVEARQQRIALARLLAALRLPSGEVGDHQQGARRPQRRAGARGVYKLRVS